MEPFLTLIRCIRMVEGLIPLRRDDTVRNVVQRCRDKLISLGVNAGSYHLTPPLHSQLSAKTIVTQFGFAPRIVDKYLDPSVFKNDPVADYVMKAGRSMTWKQAIEAQSLTAGQQEFVDMFTGLGLKGGIAVPLYGRNGRDAYSAFTFDRRDDFLDVEVVQEVVMQAQFTHRKICFLVERDFQRDIVLSSREQEVLLWLAKGKSKPQIANTLGISVATVDTFIRRIFAKLDVNDRVSAVIEGLGRGLIRI